MSRVGFENNRIAKERPGHYPGTASDSHRTSGQARAIVPSDFKIVIEDETVRVERPTDSLQHRATHGLTRALLANMVTGVSKGFSRTLEVEGTGYRMDLQGRKLVLQLGYSHPIEFDPPEGISFDVPRAGVL